VWVELRRRDRFLAWVGLGHLALAAVMGIAAAVDTRTILGINPWIKPVKFAVSIAIYVWTVAWLLGYVRAAAPGATRIISRGTGLAMVVEILCIAGQSARGVRSHFAVAAVFDETVFGVMGLMIGVNTVLAAWLLRLFLRRDTGLARPHLWGIRLGLILLLLGSLEGALMIVRGGHAVGAPDGGRGLPFVNWSTEAGDLRVAHFLALHGLQALSLFGWVVSRRKGGTAPDGGTPWVAAFAVVYLALAGLAFWQAMAGRPLLVT
jgi:hypothetical protein